MNATLWGFGARSQTVKEDGSVSTGMVRVVSTSYVVTSHHMRSKGSFAILLPVVFRFHEKSAQVSAGCAVVFPMAVPREVRV